MKKIVLLFLIGFFIHSIALLGQTSKGALQIGLSTTLSIAGEGSDIMGLGISTIKYKSNASGYTEPDPDKMTSFNLAPQLGYFIIDNLALGAEIDYVYSLQKDGTNDDKNITNIFGFGPFLRYYFPSEKVLPYIEANSLFGSSKTKYEPASGSSDESKSGIMAFGGGVGLAMPLGDKVCFDLMAYYNSITIKDKEDNPDDDRMVVGTFGLKLGIVVFLGPK